MIDVSFEKLVKCIQIILQSQTKKHITKLAK